MYVNKHQFGYTLVELVLGMAMFSFILVAITAVTSGLFASYQKGIAIRTSQQSARLVSDSIERDSSDAVKIITSAAPPHDVMCIYTQPTGGPGYMYYLYTGVIYRKSVTAMSSTCTNPGDTSGARLTNVEVTAQSLAITDNSASGYLMAEYDFIISANSATSTDIDPTTHRCTNASAYCSSTELTGSLMARGK